MIFCGNMNNNLRHKVSEKTKNIFGLKIESDHSFLILCKIKFVFSLFNNKFCTTFLITDWNRYEIQTYIYVWNYICNNNCGNNIY